MRYIISMQEKNRQKMTPYLVKVLNDTGAIIEIEENQLEALKTKVQRIEPDFKMNLGHVYWHDLGCLAQENVMIATVGKYCLCPEINYTYEIQKHKWEAQLPRKQEAIWIHCYSKSGEVNASDCLVGLQKLYRLSELLSCPLIILGNLKSELPYFKNHSLAQQIAESYLEGQRSLIVLQGEGGGNRRFYPAHFEQTKKQIVYTGETQSYLQKRMAQWLQYQKGSLEWTDLRQQSGTLYEDVFYEQIPAQQKIYVPLCALGNENCTYYESLGIQAICIGREPIMLYDEQGKINQNRVMLKHKVLPQFECPILTKVPMQLEGINGGVSLGSLEQKLNYKGEGVYIGIITEEGIDYTRTFLKSSTGATRIAGYWIQENGIQGTYYTQDQINRALASEVPNQMVPLVQGESYATTLLGLAGGKIENQAAIATEAEFLVAKIQSAPKNLQTLYTGKAEQTAILMADLVIATYKLFEAAKRQNKPLVLILPYHTNLTTHDGKGFYEHLLATIGKEPGCCLVIPTGEEGNKNHHQSLVNGNQVVSPVSLNASQFVEGLGGIIGLKSAVDSPIWLSGPDGRMERIRLDVPGIYNMDDAKVYTTGKVLSFQNGNYSVRFKIENMKKGSWQIEYNPSKVYNDTKVDLWLTEEAFNLDVTVSPSSPFITLGSNAAIHELMSVGGYDSENLVVLTASGRGCSGENEATPFCVSKGIGKIITQDDKVYNVVGSVVAASFFAGAMATLYDKWGKEKEIPYPNTTILGHILFNHLVQYESVEYPNPSQGYGVFRLETLPSLLSHTY